MAGGLISKTAEILGGQHQERASLLAMWQLSRELLPTGQVDGTKTFSVVGLATRSTLVSQEVGMGLTLLPTSFKPTSLASTRSFAAAGADQGSSSTSSAKANADATSAGSSAGEGANKDEQEPSSSGTSEEMAGAPCPEELMTELKAKEEGMAKLAAQVMLSE